MATPSDNRRTFRGRTELVGSRAMKSKKLKAPKSRRAQQRKRCARRRKIRQARNKPRGRK